MAQLTENALRVLERRYLLRGDDGAPAETPEGLFRRVASAVAQAERSGGAGGVGRPLRGPARRPGVPAQLADPDERRPPGRAARRLLRPPGGGRPGRHLRRAQMGRPHPPVGRRHRLLLLAPAPPGRRGQDHARRGQRAGLVHAGLRRRHRDHQAGRRAAGGQHGGAGRRPPRRARVHRGEARPRAGELQRLGGRPRRPAPGGGAGRALGAPPPARRCGGRGATRGGAARPDRAGLLGLRRAGAGVRRPGGGGQPHARPGPLRGRQPVRRAAPAAVRGLHARLRRPLPLRRGAAAWTGTA